MGMEMGDIRSFLAALLVCAVLAPAGIESFNMAGNYMESGRNFISGAGENRKTELFQKASAERELTMQKASYAFSVGELDGLLSENRRQDENSGQYMEAVGSLYLFPESYSGALEAYYGKEGTTAFWMVMTDGAEQRQQYECRLLQDGSLWFTYRTESGSRLDLPDYTVNDILRYARADYVYDDGEKDLEEERRVRESELAQYMEEETGGELREFWLREGRLFLINREAELFTDVTDEKEICIAQFLLKQSRRIDCQALVSEDAFAEIEKYKPEGYSLLWEKNGWSDIAVCDLNRDGRMDYVAALYPDDYEEIIRYGEGSPYEKWPQYYAAGFWLLLSGEDGSYEQIPLSDSIEYWEAELDLVEVAFVEEGILELEYFIGRSPFSNAVLRFRYDADARDFCIIRSDYRNAYDDSLLIGNTDNYGKTSLGAYFTGRQHYCEGIWESMEDIALPGGNQLGYFSDSLRYRCENSTEEEHINSLLQQKEEEVIEELTADYPSGGLDANMVVSPVFYNEKLVSGLIEIYFNDEEDNFIRLLIPVMVDKQNGEYVAITELIEKETFLRILEEWASDALDDFDSPEDKIRCMEAVEENWEQVEKKENYLKKEGRVLFLQIAEEGVRLKIREQTDSWWAYEYTIDKEYFIGTKIWEYYRQ